jgi:hypothetical protein
MKIFFDNSTPATGSNTESSTQSLDFPLTVVNSIIRREERRNLHTIVKAKLERLRSARLTGHYQEARLLDMPRLQVVKTLKPTTISFNHFYASFLPVTDTVSSDARFNSYGFSKIGHSV